MSLGLRITWNAQQVEVVVLLCAALGVIRCLAQNDTDTDTLCLDGLRRSLSGEGMQFLESNWTGDDFPCKGNMTFAGIQCSNAHVREIDLRSMKLEGTISSDIMQCTALSNLDLSANRLTGSIPLEIGQLAQLSVLNLSLNRLSGEIPLFSKAQYTSVIDLHGNDLSGSIPSSLAELYKLKILDLSYNDLSGLIPPNLANNSAGEIRFNASSFEHNKGLYGYPLAPPTSHGLSVLVIVGIGLGSGMFSLIVSFTAVCIWLRVTEQRSAAEEGKISQLMPES
ncbi:hypothetical protein R1flu_007075 [Riccia fluitans]|uniref:Leucine-rich repeat-containing N-terminal plant-type domain-containing protein n=1 Tax=Riccia fluitans TaxID=41844 RepID=A0ABD1YXU2_9MARC